MKGSAYVYSKRVVTSIKTPTALRSFGFERSGDT